MTNYTGPTGRAMPGPLPTVQHPYPPDAAHFARGNAGRKVAVRHNTEGANSGLWLSRTSPNQASIHDLIPRDDPAYPHGLRYGIVDHQDTAWHVGCAVWQGYRDDALARVALGVELESRNTLAHLVDPYTDLQYNTLAHLIAGWMFSYAIPWECVVDHKDIAVDCATRQPGRRHDPSWFDHARHQQEVAAWLAFMRTLPPAERPQYIF